MITTIIIIIEEITNQTSISFVSILESMCRDGKMQTAKLFNIGVRELAET